MMKTRRKAKAAAAETASAASTGADAGPFTIDIPDDVDIDALSNVLPDASFTTPSPDTVLALYRLVLAQGADIDSAQRDLDAANAEVEKKGIELEQVYQDKDNVARDAEAAVEAANAELAAAKKERDELAAANSKLKAELDTISSSQSSSSSEVTELKRRVEDVEREKRDLVTVITRLKQENGQREEEVTALRKNLKDARHDHEQLENQLRELRSAESTNKFKLDTLQQQLTLAQNEVQRTTESLNNTTEAYASFRRTKHQEMLALQSTHAALQTQFDTLQTNHAALESAHSQQTHTLQSAQARIQELAGRLGDHEAAYASEVGGLKRLVAIMEEREKQSREIVDKVEGSWAAMRDEAEARVRRLETVVERMGRGELPIANGSASTPGTPVRGGGVDAAMAMLSPTVAMASRAQRGGKTFTEVYADYVKLQDDFAKKTAEYEHMERTLTQVLGQIEERAPILSQQRAEYERVSNEAALLSSQLSQAIAERDALATSNRDNEQKLAKAVKEGALLEKNADDLGRQVRHLTRENARLRDPSLPHDIDADNGMAPAESVDDVIANHLVLFDSVPALQAQNRRLLLLVRQLGARMEDAEREWREEAEREQLAAVREAHEAMTEMASQLEAARREMDERSAAGEAHRREREALKSMVNRLQRGEHVDGDQPRGALDRRPTQQPSDADDESELTRLRAYKAEMDSDAGRLRDELGLAQREIGGLTAALAKANARVEYLTDRARDAAAQYDVQLAQLKGLEQRNAQLSDQLIRLDSEAARATDELVVAQGRVEQLRTECANLRAEKQLATGAQAQLLEANQALQRERLQLTDLLGNVQKMNAALEGAERGERSRLESEVRMLEQQTKDLREQVHQERDALRQTSLQKDLEQRELQSRLERAAQEQAKTRESLVAAETSKKHLEDRVGDLSRELQGNLEKLAVYERHGTVSGSPGATSGAAAGDADGLQAEVAELRSKLKVAEVDLEAARKHAEQYREISSANEAALSDLNATFDDFKASTENQIATQESNLKAIEEKLAAAMEEREVAVTALENLRKEFEGEKKAWLNDKRELEDVITNLSTNDRQSEEERTSRETEIKRAEERVQSAEDRYSREVQAHAQTLATNGQLKEQLAAVQATVRESKAAAETAQANLNSSERSWEQQKQMLQKEVDELKDRCKGLADQNNILHTHLESVSSQAARIKQAASAEGEETAGGEDADEHLHKVTAYLRQSLHVAEMQIDVKQKDIIRQQSTIEHLQRSVSDLESALQDAREKIVQNAAASAQHDELMDRINQMNILRESNATLRAESEANARKAKELETKLREVSAQLEPAKEQARVAKAELESRDAHIKKLEAEVKNWQERVQQLMSKYNRADPAELQTLKDQSDALTKEVAELKQQQQTLEAQLAEKTEQLAAKDVELTAKQAKMDRWRATEKENMSRFKKRMADANEREKTYESSTTALNAKIAELEAANQALKAQSEKLEADATAAPAADSAPELVSAGDAALREERDRLLEENKKLMDEKTTWTIASATGEGAAAPSDEVRSAWEAEKAELVKARDEAVAKAQVRRQSLEATSQEISRLRDVNEKLKQQMAQVANNRSSDLQRALQEKDHAVKAAEERIRAEVQSGAQPADVAKHIEELRALEERLTKEHEEKLKKAVEAAVAAAPGVNKGDSKFTDKDISDAVERGRQEAGMKVKLKEKQLMTMTHRLKQFEAAVQKWQSEGVVPKDSLTTITKAAAGATAPPPTPTASAPPSTLPAKPGVATTSAAAPAASTSASAGPSNGAAKPTEGAAAARGRGTARGARGGGARGGAARGRGAAPATRSVNSALAAATGNAAGGGVSIMGAAAAAKRQREETGGEGALAKRIKTDGAEGQPAAKTGAPVQIRRPPPPGPTS
ncbi:hypothetical protein HDZ31DRAFT_42546 [Schizophyllum fasciatum]